jgi:hypothetical protein
LALGRLNGSKSVENLALNNGRFWEIGASSDARFGAALEA